MQIGGLGSSHGTSDHHVTNCIHDHHDIQKKNGGAAMEVSAAMEASGAKAELQQEGLFSLSTWIKNMLGSGKGFLLNFWDGGQASGDISEGNQTVVNSAEGSQAAVHRAVMQAEDPSQTAVVTVQPTVQYRTDHNASYFYEAYNTETQNKTLWQKIRSRFHNMSGQLSGRRSQKVFSFQTKNFFHTRQEKPEEDLYKHSRHRKDTVEINYAQTEDSYLMDSYDRRGEYSRLTTKK